MERQDISPAVYHMLEYSQPTTKDVEAIKFLMLPLPAPFELLCFRVHFRFLYLGIFCFCFRIELVASEFASDSSLFHQSASASTKI